MLSHARQLLAEYKMSRAEEIQLVFEDYRLVIRPIGEEAVLSVMHDLTFPPDLVNHYINRAISSLERLI